MNYSDQNDMNDLINFQSHGFLIIDCETEKMSDSRFTNFGIVSLLLPFLC